MDTASKTIVGLFERQVAKSPSSVAIIAGERCVSYAELNGKANQLASRLRAQGVTAEELVAVCLDRSIEMVAALLGVLKCGAAYVPLDPEYPRERLQFTLADAKVKTLVTARHLSAAIGDTAARSIFVDDADAQAFPSADAEQMPATAPDIAPDNLAYVIYTSGSSGEPKGVAIEHGAFVDSFHKHMDAFAVAGATFLQRTSMSFDVMTWELYWPLLTGGKVVLLDGGSAGVPADILALCAKHQVKVCTFVPSQLAGIVDEIERTGRRVDLEYVFCGGDTLTVALAGRFCRALPRTSLVNCYGPTESTAGLYEVLTHTNVDENGDTISLGRPMNGTRIRLLDSELQPVPAGLIGELCIGGSSLARGYLNRDALTAERFIPDPFIADSDEQLYRTGDLARLRPDGKIEFLGRSDQQVKIRGFRIELGEIETRLAGFPGVREAAVIAREDTPGDKRLVAYYITQQSGVIDAGQLRRYLSDRLPDHMVPSAFVELDRWPLTPNGKRDLKALPAPRVEGSADLEDEAPRGELEQTLARIWSEVLGSRRIGRRDDFFDMGGDSLLALQVSMRARDALNIEIPLSLLFEETTIERLSRHLGGDCFVFPPPLAGEG